MREVLLGAVLIGAIAAAVTPDASAQPADCATQPAAGPAMNLAIDLAGRPGVPAAVTGKAFVAVPMQAPRTECGEPSSPADVLGGEPGDLLRGTPSHEPVTR
jgi:hypothetical protein